MGLNEKHGDLMGFISRGDLRGFHRIVHGFFAKKHGDSMESHGERHHLHSGNSAVCYGSKDLVISMIDQLF